MARSMWSTVTNGVLLNILIDDLGEGMDSWWNVKSKNCYHK